MEVTDVAQNNNTEPEKLTGKEAEEAQKLADATAAAEKEAADKDAQESKAADSADTAPQPGPSAERMMMLTLEERNKRMAEDREAAVRLNSEGATVTNDNGTITATFGKK